MPLNEKLDGLVGGVMSSAKELLAQPEAKGLVAWMKSTGLETALSQHEHIILGLLCGKLAQKGILPEIAALYVSRLMHTGAPIVEAAKEKGFVFSDS